MSEIKYDGSKLSEEISAIGQQCKQVDVSSFEGYKGKTSPSNMPSCISYIDENNSFITLIKLYLSLVEQDIQDLKNMYLSAEELDAKIGKSFDR